LGISFIPGIPGLKLDPEIIFLIFLPPILYEAAWYTSWNDFWKWKRPISLLAFGLVFLTSVIVAYASQMIIPDCWHWAFCWGDYFASGCYCSNNSTKRDESS
jgi:CPA1 family monovalent cation:H+ antiporter